jgi:hypothetical protein
MENSIFTEEQIQHILKLYKQNKEKNKANYEKVKDTEEFKMKNRERAKEHYHNNKHLKQNHYMVNKELIKARNSYRYYMKRDRVEEFKEKYPLRYEKLVHSNYIKPETEKETDAQQVNYSQPFQQ